MLYDLAEVFAHIVDLNRSKWDRERSIPEKGIFVFEKSPDAKVYIKQSDYMDAASRPKHVLKFIDIERLPYYRSKFGASPVLSSDPYWPEPMTPDSEGKFVIMDALLVKIEDMEGYLDYRWNERERGKAGIREEGRQFQDSARGDGAGLSKSEFETIERQNLKQ